MTELEKKLEDALRKKVVELKLAENKLERSEQILHEPIAIIGMSCRFPGGANNINDFWNLLERGGDAITKVPASRWDVDSFYDPDPNVPGKMITDRAGFLDVDVSLFDADFFGISPREALSSCRIPVSTD